MKNSFVVWACAAFFLGCVPDSIVCDVPPEECPQWTDPNLDEAACPGGTVRLVRPDVCASYPFGDVYLGAVTCSTDGLGCGHVAEIWCTESD